MQSQLKQCLNAFFLLTITVGIWLMSLNSVHSRSGLKPETSNPQMLMQEKSFSEFSIHKLTLNETSSLLVTDENGIVINQVGHQEFQLIELVLWSIHAILAYVLMLSVWLFLRKQNRKWVMMSLVAVLTVSLTGSLSNLQMSQPQHVSLPWQLAWAMICYVLLLINHNKLSQSQTQNATLLAYASQSGTALHIAKYFNDSLPNTFDLRCVSTLKPESLSHYTRALFIASTYGDGEPPEKAQRFMTRINQAEPFTKRIEFSVLALGDRSYPHFCAFGHQLATLLQTKGAKTMSPVTEVDKSDRSVIDGWWRDVSQTLPLNDGKPITFEVEASKLKIISNKQLNANNNQRPAHRISLSHPGLTYQAGDLLEVLPRANEQQCLNRLKEQLLDANHTVTHLGKKKSLISAIRDCHWTNETATTAQDLIDQLKPLAPRVYSIASAPSASSTIDVFVRRHTQEDGSPGLASHFLCDSKAKQTIKATIRTHPNFHLPQEDCPLILIGAGTGIAPLIGLLKERAVREQPNQHWLFFGEQNEQDDFYFKEDIFQMLETGSLTHLTTAWSRQNDGHIHNKMALHADSIKHWIKEEDAVVFVCGRQIGFGESTTNRLSEILTPEGYAQLKENNRIRTDLY